MIKELMLPPGPDGKAHPDYYIDDHNEPIVTMSECGGGLRIRPTGSKIRQHHAAAIAFWWMLAESNCDSSHSMWPMMCDQIHAWSAIACGSRDYDAVPIVGYRA